MQAHKICLKACLVILLGICASLSYAAQERHLVDTMTKLQYLTHKTGLSLDAGNVPAARFYAHELDETIEELVDFGLYENMPVGKLTKSILLEKFRILEENIEAGKQQAALGSFRHMIDSCNKCHQSTDHGYIKVSINHNNPYMQSFSK